MVVGVVYTMCGLSLAISVWMARWVIAKPTGPAAMQEIAQAIREGGEGFLATQYSAIAKYALGMAFLLFLLYTTRPPIHPEVSTMTLAILTACTFSTGAFFSAIAGYGEQSMAALTH